MALGRNTRKEAPSLAAHTASITAALMLVTALAIGWGMASVLADAPAYVRVQQ